jgi:hypothetical protein
MQNRVDLYAAIHKAYRAFLFDTLLRVGRIDVADPVEFDDVLARVNALLSSLRHHAKHEDNFLHPLLLAANGRRPSSAAEHVEHETAIAALETLVDDVRAAPPAEREGMALRLYRCLGAFAATDLDHMLGEEIDNNADLWRHYTDAQLIDAHNALLASIEPAVFIEIMAWMLPALTPNELVQVLEGTRANAPAPVFGALMGMAADSLPATRYAALCKRLGIASADVAGEALAA